MWLNSGKTYEYLVSGLNWGNTSTNSFVTVSDTGNPAFSSSAYGVGTLSGINYIYQISKYEITNNEYCLFLNSVDPDGSNPNSIYLANDIKDISLFALSVAGFRYVVSNNKMGNKPVTGLTFGRIARYCNWLSNGAKRYTFSNSLSTAPQNTGAYNIGTSLGTILLVDGSLYTSLSPDNNARFRLPTYAEWLKAAYYNGSGSYWSYATQNNLQPDQVSANSNGDGILNIIFYNRVSNARSDIFCSNGVTFQTNNISFFRNDTLVSSNTGPSCINSFYKNDVFLSNNVTFSTTNYSLLKNDIFANSISVIYNAQTSLFYEDIFLTALNTGISTSLDSLFSDIFVVDTNKYIYCPDFKCDIFINKKS